MLLVWGCDWFNINSVFPNHLDIRWCSSEQEQESFVKTITMFPNTSDIIVKNVQRPSLTWTQSFFRAEDRLDMCVGQILPTIPSLVKSPSVSQVEQNQVVNGPHCLRLCPDQLFLLWRCCAAAPPGGHRVGFIVRLATFYFYNFRFYLVKKKNKHTNCWLVHVAVKVSRQQWRQRRFSNCLYSSTCRGGEQRATMTSRRSVHKVSDSHCRIWRAVGAGRENSIHVFTGHWVHEEVHQEQWLTKVVNYISQLHGTDLL